MDVYADLLFLINFSMDFLCLFLSVRLLHLKQHTGRMLLAAVLGGIYSVASLFFQARSGLALLIDVCTCMLMCVVCAAGKGVRFPRLLLLGGTYFGISALMGGGMTAIYHLLNKANLPLDEVGKDGISAWMFLALATAAALTAVFGQRLFSRQSARRTCTVRIRMEDATWELSGLCDSGNLLCDPISGTPVIVADRQTWLSRLPRELRRAVESTGRDSDAGAYAKRIRIVPMQTAQGSAMTIALMPDEVMLEEPNGNKRAVHALIAPSGQPLKGEYCAIVPATLMQ